jgi:hypothetical protein
MKVGFTGTQQGMTQAQLEKLHYLLSALEIEELHHGDCIGADIEAHVIGRVVNLKIVVHPPANSGKRAWASHADEYRRVLPYLARNEIIVEETDCLFATPSGEEKLRSGTWATIRYARKRQKVVTIIWPNGRVETEMR